MFHHLSETTATGLQHHVCRTYAFLRQDNTCQALAIPALLADLYEQDNLLLGNRSVERSKVNLRAFGFGVLLIATMIFQYHVGRIQSVGRDNLGYQRTTVGAIGADALVWY